MSFDWPFSQLRERELSLVVQQPKASTDVWLQQLLILAAGSAGHPTLLRSQEKREKGKQGPGSIVMQQLSRLRSRPLPPLSEKGTCLNLSLTFHRAAFMRPK